jgi:His-Xaa-Ser system protein HxsD
METSLAQQFKIDFDSKAFSLLAIQKACHRFSNVASFEVKVSEEQESASISISVTPTVEKTAEGLHHLERKLRNEALEQQLREQIRAQTEGVRNLILAHAFSRTGLIAETNRSPQLGE